MAKPKLRTVRLDEIVIDPRAQARADGLDERHVAQMVDDVDKLPPPHATEFGGRIHLDDGFHRYEAHKRAKKIRLQVLVAAGTEDDWIDAFASANHDQYAKPRTNEDKRTAVRRVLELRPQWSNVRVSEAAKVDEKLVRKVKKEDVQVRPAEPETTASDDKQVRENAPEITAAEPMRVEGKDGKKYPATASKSKPAQAVAPPEPPAADEPVIQETAPFDAHSEQAHTDGDDSVPGAAPEASDDAPPEPAADPADAFTADLAALCYELDAIGQRVAALKDSPFASFVHSDSAKVQIKNGRETLWQGRLTHECPYCRVAGETQPACKCCRGFGVCTKDQHKRGVAAVGEGNR